VTNTQSCMPSLPQLWLERKGNHLVPAPCHAQAVRLSWATLLSNYSVLYRQGGQQAGGDQEEAKLQVSGWVVA
jgi:hypothetical protein